MEGDLATQLLQRDYNALRHPEFQIVVESWIMKALRPFVFFQLVSEYFHVFLEAEHGVEVDDNILDLEIKIYLVLVQFLLYQRCIQFFQFLFENAFGF